MVSIQDDPRDLLELTPEFSIYDLDHSANSKGRKHLEIISHMDSFPISLTSSKGIMIGCMTIAIDDSSPIVNVVSIIKTGSYNNYLTYDALYALGYKDPLPNNVTLICVGEKTQFLKKSNPLSKTNIIGVSFLSNHSLIINGGINGYIK